MRRLLVALLLVALAHVGLSAQGGDPQQGKARWENVGSLWCNRCHGNRGEGGLGRIWPAAH
jgi:hypothetical protein